MKRGLSIFAMSAVLLAAGCKPAPMANQADNLAVNVAGNIAQPEAPAPVATSAAVAASPMAQWLVGSWSAEASCASDFIAHYNADGTLQYGEDSGKWTLTGDTVTEAITERFAMESDAPQKLPKPETRSYKLVRIDAGHGTIVYEGRKVAIQRC
ncbi:MAG: hypothetical protein EOP60_08115 [Sphingomonadales bacterium]|nr:MAG: hypothetical protein EOP60_08115 [Sphingomonadales bacterium]